MTRPRLLDLFCGAGGSAVGYYRAGFDVVGVDIEPQPNYPFEFHRGEWWESLFELAADIDVIHASPPCQAYSVTASLHTTPYPKLIERVRDVLRRLDRPYIIENVEGARRDMPNRVKLCGSSFGLGVRRHRLFETSWHIMFPPACAHYLQPEPVDVTGTGGPATRLPGSGGGIHRKPRNLAHARKAMGIDWMTRPELAEAIPPAYTEYVGAQLLEHLVRAA